jgi:hypothetical protein
MQYVCEAGSYLGIYHCAQPTISLEMEQQFVDHVAAWGLSYGT